MNKELEEIKQEAKVKVRRKTDRGKIGFGIAVVAMFSILMLMNFNLSTAFSRRTPFMEYNVCYNERDSAERRAQNEVVQCPDIDQKYNSPESSPALSGSLCD